MRAKERDQHGAPEKQRKHPEMVLMTVDTETQSAGELRTDLRDVQAFTRNCPSPTFAQTGLELYRCHSKC